MNQAATAPTQAAPKKSKKMLWVWLGIAVFFIAEILMFPYVKPNMDRVTHLHGNITEIFGWQVPLGGINGPIVINTWFVMSIMIGFAIWGRLRWKKFPGRRQGFFEVIVEAFGGLCRESLGERLGRSVTPYIITLFFFILSSNWLLCLYLMRWVEEPTLSLSTTLGLGTIAFMVSHGLAIKEKGFLRYLAHYFEPMIEIGKYKIPNLIFFPLHVIGECGKLISHSFRLFGNILGGVIIYVVVTYLIRHIILPPLLHLFFGIAVGSIQAFVFTLLALTYIAILTASHDEEEAHGH